MKKYHTIVNGATILGLAIACCDPEGTLIIEKSSVIGSDFYSSLRVDHLYDYKPKENNTKELYKTIFSKGTMNFEDIVLINEIMPILGNMIIEKKINILLDCHIISLKTEGSFQQCNVVCRDQILTFAATNYVDTTINDNTKYSSYHFNLITKSERNILEGVEPEKIYSLGKGIHIVELELVNGDIHLAREKAIELFRKPMNNDSQLLMVAEVPYIRGEYYIEKKDNTIYACSSLSYNFFDAFDRGITLWRTL